MLTIIIVVIAAAFWLSMMAIAIALPVSVDIIRITKPFICPPGSRLEVRTDKTRAKRPGERGLVVLCHSTEGTKDVKGKALTTLWLFFFLLALSGSALAAALWWEQIYALLFG